MSDEKRTYIAGVVGRLRVLEDDYPLKGHKHTISHFGSSKTHNEVSVFVKGLSSYCFGTKRGRVIESREMHEPQSRIVCRVASDNLIVRVALVDAKIKAAEAELAKLHKERQDMLEAEIPFLEVAPVGEIIDQTKQTRARQAREAAERAETE